MIRGPIREVDWKATCAGKKDAYNGLIIDHEDVMADLNSMDNVAFDAWLLEQSGTPGASDDEQLIEVFSKALREESPEGRAQSLIDVANLCIAMADKSLGSQVPVSTCLTLTRH
jgi:hypothetical protein